MQLVAGFGAGSGACLVRTHILTTIRFLQELDVVFFAPAGTFLMDAATALCFVLSTSVYRLHKCSSFRRAVNSLVMLAMLSEVVKCVERSGQLPRPQATLVASCKFVVRTTSVCTICLACL